MSARFVGALVAPFALLAGLSIASPALAQTALPRASGSAALIEAAATMKPGQFDWRADDTAGRLSIVISLADQRAYVFRGQDVVAVSTVSSGKQGKETPVGVFTILQKNVEHKSNLYSAAPMPYMQRLTWDGIALHAGKNPGYAASHGCIRLPMAFAKKLYAATATGAVVEVTDMPFWEGMPAPISEEQRVAQANRDAQRALDLDLSFASR